MKCKCGKSEIPDEKPEYCDIILCPLCNRKYTYVKQFKDDNFIGFKVMVVGN